MDELERKERYARLLDIYGSLLGEEQLKRAKDYYFSDYSLAEMAEREGTSRSAIHLSIRAAERKLDEYESKLHLSVRISEVERELDKIEKKSFQRECERIRRILNNGI
ncbi:MAG TPA: DNA-binding protein [Firmicutes bacterium]|nr:DNA-binding protein [Bacillota bacterium]